jgi:hypothetical protein
MSEMERVWERPPLLGRSRAYLEGDDDDERDRCMVEDAPALLAGPLKSVEATTTTMMSEIEDRLEDAQIPTPTCLARVSHDGAPGEHPLVASSAARRASVERTIIGRRSEVERLDEV